ncbi:hypothetical protein EGW08_019322 [Elysia chlorotica]|uniref:Neurotransmitter-gated ion-channel ligand-binding domain-containing protein n=1 Tax=Elysia chlorotica TaxID=188477 RepID=A0A3S0ZE50_ELYCH|nr:hypothetical protein EGW08_019322 [Elysia chlorotica]
MSNTLIIVLVATSWILLSRGSTVRPSMDLTMLTLIAIGFILLFNNGQVSAQTYNQTTELMRSLFGGYDKNVRPVLNQSDTIDVRMEIGLRAIEHLNEKDQIITMSIVLVMQWVDEILTWDPSNHGNVTSIQPGTDMLWLPLLNLWGRISDHQLMMDISQVTPIEVSHTGLVTWFMSIRLIQTCRMDMTYFPNDEHQCLFEIYTHTYLLHQVRLQLMSTTPTVKNYLENVEYECIASPLQSILIPTGVGDQKYQIIATVLFELVLLSNVGVNLTARRLYALIYIDYLVVLITQFLAILMSISVLSVVVTVMSLVIHHRDETDQAKKSKSVSILRHWKKLVAEKLFRPSISVQPSKQSPSESAPKKVFPPTDVENINSTTESLVRRNASTKGQDLRGEDSVSNQSSYLDFNDSREFAFKNESSAFHSHENAETNEIKNLTPINLETKQTTDVERTSTSLQSVATHSVLSKVQPLYPGHAADFGVRSDTATKVKANLDMVFFWLFLAAWLCSTLGYVIAIFG